MGAPVAPDLRLGPEAMIALVIHGCYQFGASMSGLFLNLYLWRLTGDLAVNGVYNILVFVVTPIGFAVGGWISKKKDRMVTYRLGLVTIALFYLCVVIAQEKVAEYYAIFAIFHGMTAGFYWVGYLVLMYDVSNASNRIRFLAVNMIVFNSAGLAGPAVAGLIIQMNEGLRGYIITFLIAFVMFAAAAVVSFKIKAIVSRHKPYYLKYTGLLMRKNILWFRGLVSFLVLGLFQGIMLFLPNILLFQTVGREDWVGYLGVFFSAVTVATGYVIARKANKEHVKRYLFFSTTGTLLGASLLLFDVRFWSVLPFMTLFSICNPLALNTMSSYYYRLMDDLPLKGQLRIESVVMRETFLNTGRVLSIGLLLVLSEDLQSVWLPVVLVAMALLQYTLTLLVKENEPEPVHATKSVR
jgi:YQGE family putative transporter